MTRPLYESREDRAHEQQLVTRFAGAFGRRARKLPLQYRLDYAIINERDDVLAFAEAKWRSHAFGQYPTLILSLNKVLAAMHLSSAFGRDSWLVVRWADCCGYTRITGDYRVTILGRSDRGDWQDIEPVCHIPAQSFQLLKEQTDV